MTIIKYEFYNEGKGALRKVFEKWTFDKLLGIYVYLAGWYLFLQ